MVERIYQAVTDDDAPSLAELCRRRAEQLADFGERGIGTNECLDGLIVPCLVFDERGICRFMNSRARRLFRGAPRGHAPWRVAVNPEHHDKLRELLTKPAGCAVLSVSTVRERAASTRHLLEIAKAPIRTGGSIVLMKVHPPVN